MDNDISNKEIESAVIQLENSYGIKEPISPDKISSLLRRGKVKDAIEVIASQYGLPIEINVINVPNFFSGHNSSNQFHSTQLSKFHPIGSGNEGITAQVTIPVNLPRFGSPALNKFKIDVRISENCTRNPLVFSLIIAHELSHVFLHSCDHSQKDNEFFTDINAIMQGFLIIFQSGRKIIYEQKIKGPELVGQTSTTIRTTTTTYGYLSDNQFIIVHTMLKSKIENNRMLKRSVINQIAKSHRKLKLIEIDSKIVVSKYQYYLKHLTKFSSKYFSNEDNKLIARYFLPSFLDEYYISTDEIKNELKSIETFVEGLNHYTLNKMSQLAEKSKYLKNREAYLMSKLSSFKASINALNKFVNVFIRFRILLILLFKKNKMYYFR